MQWTDILHVGFQGAKELVDTKKFTILSKGDKQVLMINDVQFEDAEEFSCRATNSAGTKSTRAELKIKCKSCFTSAVKNVSIETYQYVLRKFVCILKECRNMFNHLGKYTGFLSAKTSRIILANRLNNKQLLKTSVDIYGPSEKHKNRNSGNDLGK